MSKLNPIKMMTFLFIARYRRPSGMMVGIFLFSLIFALGCESATNEQVELGENPFGAELQNMPIQEIVAQTFVLQDFEAMLVASKVAGELDSPPYTFFAPWDYAFKRLPYWTKITQNRAWYGHLRDLTLGHIHSGNLSKDKIEGDMTVTMLNGDTSTVSKESSRIRVDGERVIGDTAASDGYLYMLDHVREPKWTTRTLFDIINEDERFSILAQILNHPSMSAKREELKSEEAELTFFPPTNEALAGFNIDNCTDTDCSATLDLLFENHLVDAVVPKKFTSTQTLATQSGTSLDWNYNTQSVTCTADQIQEELELGGLNEEFALNGIVYPVTSLLCMKIPCVGTTNIALNKRTNQSSVYSANFSSKAVDGNKSRKRSDNSYSMTNWDKNPWWRVDFGSIHTVKGVKIWTVEDNESVLQDFRVDCLDDKGEVIKSDSFQGAVGETIELDIQSKNVYSIKITSHKTTNLYLAEVEVYGFPQNVFSPNTCADLGADCGVIDDGTGNELKCGSCSSGYSCEQNRCVPTNIAFNRFTQQSSTSFGAESSRAVDGNTSRTFSQDTCALTRSESAPWWRVDLNGPHKVTGVKIWTLIGREEQLNDFHVDCLDEHGNVIITKTFKGTANETIEFNFIANSVYAVRIEINKKQYQTFDLPLCEVEVYGESESACIPKTCEEVDSTCGATKDGCGGTIDCGGCQSGYSCMDNQCEIECPIDSCADVGASCGYIYNNCHATIDCGTCGEGSSCFQHECVSCTPKSCAEISSNTCGEVDDGCGNIIDCGACNERTTFLVPIHMDKKESWEEFAFLATVPAAMKTNGEKPSVIAVEKGVALNSLHLDYLRRYRPGNVYTAGTKDLYEGNIKLNAATLDEYTCELAQFFGTSDTAVMSNSKDYHKSLSASGLAGRLRAPLFFFNGTIVSSATMTCLQGLGVKKVIAVGASTQVAGTLSGKSIQVQAIKDEYEVISWLEANGFGVDYFAVCNSYDRSHFFAPKSSLAAPILAAARNGAVVPLSMASEFNTPCKLTLTDKKPQGAAQGFPFKGKYQWKTGTCHVNGINYNVVLSRQLENNEHFGQANIDFNGDGDYSGQGEYFLKGELRKFGNKTYLVDIGGRNHFADVRFTYPHAAEIKSKLQKFHAILGHHPKYMVLVGLPDAIPPHQIIHQAFDLVGTMTDYVYSDVDDDPLIDIALGRFIGDTASIATLSAARSTTYEDLRDSRWRDNTLTTGGFDRDREGSKKVFENRGFNVDSIRLSSDIKDVEYAYIWHHDHGTAWSINQKATGGDHIVPISPAVVLSVGCSMANITDRRDEGDNFSGYGSVKLFKKGAVGIYADSKNTTNGSDMAAKVSTIHNTLLYEGATLGEAHLHALNAVMLEYEPYQGPVWRPIFYGDPALKPSVPNAAPAIEPAKTVAKRSTVTAYAPQGTWVVYNWNGTCPDKPETKYDYNGPGLVLFSNTCSWPQGSSITMQSDKGVRYISKFNVDGPVNGITQQDGIAEGLGWNHTDHVWYYAPQRYIVNEHWDGTSTVYMNLRFSTFNHVTGDFDQSYSQIKYYIH